MSRDSWGSRIAFLFSGIGFAIGFGNIWRFPYLVGLNGGAVFIAFFLFVVVLIAIPAFTIELALGKATRTDPVGAYRKLAPRRPWFANGYLNLATVVLILGYGTVVTGWIVAYGVNMALGQFTSDSIEDTAAYFDGLIARPLEVLAWAVPHLILLAVVVTRGLQRGIEAANKLLIPALFGILVLLLIRAASLPKVGEGLEFYLMPDFSAFNSDAAITAIGQAFFSIGVAMATGLVYGSYMRAEDGVLSSAAAIAIADTVAAFLAGMVIFPFVFSFGLQPDAGVGLTFVTMSAAFSQMPLGRVFGTLFYMLFFFAAFSSLIGAAEGVIAHLRDQWGIPRRRCVVLVMAMTVVLAIPAAVSIRAFNLMDSATGYTLVIGGLVMALFVGWVWPVEKFLDVAGIESTWARRLWSWDIKFVVPSVILLLLASQLGLLG